MKFTTISPVPGLAMLVLAMTIGERASAQADMMTIENSQFAQIERHGICRRVRNRTGASIMVPHRFPEEWSLGTNSFLGAVPPGVVVSECRPTGIVAFRTENDCYINYDGIIFRGGDGAIYSNYYWIIVKSLDHIPSPCVDMKGYTPIAESFTFNLSYISNWPNNEAKIRIDNLNAKPVMPSHPDFPGVDLSLFQDSLTPEQRNLIMSQCRSGISSVRVNGARWNSFAFDQGTDYFGYYGVGITQGYAVSFRCIYD